MDKNDISQNLKDAGCDLTTINEFFRLKNTGQKQELLHLLSKHKTVLLESLYENQKKIDCLDFLIFSLKERF